ncbi:MULTISPECIES: hypothetical protein [Niastella]|uniref:DUF4595 domain-containing protein n=1 Tax=Niastella soli TaxID=2821487 RepID=A0ABS3YW93_9BACT|nr:hypothetical protein [Niastella soli]MBO9202190.1 hypothetical protein [Niastella soli]
MSRSLTLASVLLSICVFSSCRRESADLSVGFRLKKYIITFDNFPANYHFYERDLLGKLIGERDSSNNQVLSMNLLYENRGSVSKAEFRQNGGPVTFSYEFEIDDAYKRITKRQRRAGTIAVNEDYNVYAYDNVGRLIADSQYSITNGTYQLAWVSKFMYDGANATLAESYKMENGTLELYARLKNEYDGKINPLRNQENVYFYNEAGNAIYAIATKSAGNVVKQYLAKGHDDFQLVQTASYQYNANNYAWQASTVNEIQPGMNAVTVYTFE